MEWEGVLKNFEFFFIEKFRLERVGVVLGYIA